VLLLPSRAWLHHEDPPPVSSRFHFHVFPAFRGESNRSAAPQQAARPAGSLPAPSFCAFFAACEPGRCPLIQESGILLARSLQMGETVVAQHRKGRSEFAE